MGQAIVTGQSVTVRVTSLPGGGPEFTARLVCTWHPGYAPTDTDAALVGVLADHATAVVHRERTTGQLADSSTAHQVGAALGRAQRVAAATGILMALHHLTATQARQLLARAGDRTHRSLLDVADSVLHTGALPDNRTTHTDTSEQEERPERLNVADPSTEHRNERAATGSTGDRPRSILQLFRHAACCQGASRDAVR